MTHPDPIEPAPPSCTAFDAASQVASGSYLHVALVLQAYAHERPEAPILVFDDTTGQQVDLDLRGSEADIAARLRQRFPAPPVEPEKAPEPAKTAGRPKLGVVAREVTLLPQHWDWLAGQPGGASATLRRLVEEARRSAPADKARLRQRQERAYRFMSAIAGNFPSFEEASRALFADDMLRLSQLVAGWPHDVRTHLAKLCSDQPGGNAP